MKRLLYILLTLFSTLLLTSCSWSDDLNEYTDDSRSNRPDAYYYFWYYNPDLFKDVEYCQVIGRYELSDPSSDDDYGYYTNQRCYVYDDTIFLKKRTLFPDHIYFNGSIIIDDNEFQYRFKLN
jgi:hypothetical protein